MARVGADLRVFEILNNASNPKSIASLANETGAAPELTGEYFRAKDCVCVC